MKEWNEYTYFERIPGSTIYPSDNPLESPFDKFQCKLCGYTFEEQIYGSFPLGHKPEREAEKKMCSHLAMFHSNEINKEKQ